MTIKIMKAKNHAETLDNYMDKYMPIRMQTQINETLYSLLSGTERKRLQLYESDKSFLLYKTLLEDDGLGTIDALCRAMHEIASKQMADIEYREEKMRDI